MSKKRSSLGPPLYLHLPQLASRTIFGLMQSIKRSGIQGIVTGVLPIVGLITMLLALAILQLRWSAKVSEAERARLQENLQRSTTGFQSAFVRDLLGICQTLQASQPRDPNILTDHLFDRYLVWRRVSRHAAMIRGLYIQPQSDIQTGVLLKLNPQTYKLEPTAWPDSLRAFTGQQKLLPHHFRNRLKGWLWSEQAAALIHPLYVTGVGKDADNPQFYGYLFVVFNTPNFEEVYLPELGRRYFPPSNGFIFQLVSRDGDRQRVAYQSDKHSSQQVFPHADAAIPLLEDSSIYRSIEVPQSAGVLGAPLNRVFLSAAGTPRWQIVIRHRSGSVDAAVTDLRRRNLAVSVVVLLMLLVSLITILIATRRARRLAQLQMEFASGISHELRTPLAVIRSAAENLADGVVSETNRVRDYGALIHKESQRLSGMVDHILDFAHLQAGAPNYRLETVSVTDVFEQVLTSEGPQIRSVGVALEIDVPDDLPLLFTDASVLSQCLQNLLSNALKYGSGGQQIVLRASEAHEDGQAQVQIAVQDFGDGIAPEELAHIYEPFYRTAAARESQAHGTGLGLSLTRNMIEGLGGRITVNSSTGKGSIFTLHVPASTRDNSAEATRETSHSG